MMYRLAAHLSCHTRRIVATYYRTQTQAHTHMQQGKKPDKVNVCATASTCKLFTDRKAFHIPESKWIHCVQESKQNLCTYIR